MFTFPSIDFAFYFNMDAKNIALCHVYRNPVRGGKKLSFPNIAKLVKKKDGKHPTKEGVRLAVKTFGKKKRPVGRKVNA